MSVSNELFLSLLAMDSYNRGYTPGMTDLSSDPGTRIGNAVILANDLPSGSEAAGFYALSYTWNGQTVISYRGTDNVGFLGGGDGASDFWRGWINGAGVLMPGGQALLAVQFYNSVTGGDVMAGVSGGAVLTGHSLGGGLAGFNPAAIH
jgi:hypothetical protein